MFNVHKPKNGKRYFQHEIPHRTIWKRHSFRQHQFCVYYFSNFASTIISQWSKLRHFYIGLYDFLLDLFSLSVSTLNLKSQPNSLKFSFHIESFHHIISPLWMYNLYKFELLSFAMMKLVRASGNGMRVGRIRWRGAFLDEEGRMSELIRWCYRYLELIIRRKKRVYFSHTIEFYNLHFWKFTHTRARRRS